MAFHIDREVTWGVPERPDIKYGVRFVMDCEMVSQTNTNAQFHLTGNIILTNNPTGPQNVWRASDYAVLSIGNAPANAYPFAPNTDYYQRPLPFAPSAPQSVLDAILVEFRGDTYRTDGANRSSLYIRGSGVVVDTDAGAFTRTFPIDTTFDLPLTGDSSQVVLVYDSSGASSSTDYGWGNPGYWASIFDFDYRPGMIWNGTTFMSHNRNNGIANIWDGSSWQTMRTENGGVGTGNPPLIYNGTDYVNQKKIGQE